MSKRLLPQKQHPRLLKKTETPRDTAIPVIPQSTLTDEEVLKLKFKNTSREEFKKSFGEIYAKVNAKHQNKLMRAMLNINLIAFRRIGGNDPEKLMAFFREHTHNKTVKEIYEQFDVFMEEVKEYNLKKNG